jgi:hypothetical protein
MNKLIAKISKLVLTILLLAAATVYLANVVQPKLHYQLQQPAFLSGSDFFYQHFKYPGGMADYFSEFLMQFFMQNWLGSIVLIFLALLLSITIIRVINNVFRTSNFDYLSIGLPIILIAALAGNYLLPLTVIVKIVISSIFVLMFSIINFKSIYKLLSFIFFAILIYCFSGGIALYFFAFIVILIRINQPGLKQKIIFCLSSILITTIIPFIAYHSIFDISLKQSIAGFLPDRPVMLLYHLNPLIYIFLGFFPVIFILESIYNLLVKNILGENNNNIPNKYIFAILISVQIIILISTGYYLLKNSNDERQKNELLVNYYAENEDWQKVVETAKNFKEYDYKINFEYNRAIFHLGKFTENLFSYPQLLGSESLFIDINVAGSITQMSSDLYFDLGHITESLRWAYETQTLLPNSPRVLKRIVIGNIILGNYEAANTYINLLKKNFRYKSWAEKYDKFIANPELTNTDNLISEKRIQLPKHCITPVNPVVLLEDLLQSDPKNKMAYEYLEAYFLFNHDLNSFMKNLEMMNNYGYAKIPKSFEEAILLYMTKKQENTLPKEMISGYTTENFKDFSKILANAKGKKEYAQSALYRYSDSYWYYIIYLSPIVTKNQLKIRDGK